MKKGLFFGQEYIDKDTRAIRDYYGERGFPDWQRYRTLERDRAMEVLDPSLIVDPEKAEVHVVHRIREGRKVKINRVLVTGNEQTRDHVIRRNIRVHPGDTLDEVELQDSARRLRNLGYFGDRALGDPGVRVRLLPVEGSDDTVDVEVDVTESSTGRILFGAGFSSNTGSSAASPTTSVTSIGRGLRRGSTLSTGSCS
jgi:outer membrane protein insertion porin family